MAYPPIDIIAKYGATKPQRLFDWMRKNPSFSIFRCYINNDNGPARRGGVLGGGGGGDGHEEDHRRTMESNTDDLISYVDFDIATAHAQIKDGKKNEDRWDNVAFNIDPQSDRVIPHIDLDDLRLRFQQGNIRKNESGLNVHPCRGVFVGM